MSHGKQHQQFTDLHRLINVNSPVTILVTCSYEREEFLRTAFRAHPLFAREAGEYLYFKNDSSLHFVRPVEAA